jgi:catechol 2,3-dioxygenase-like lactoylglutathione lyase family enzyme
MKRVHVHVAVDDLQASIHFYTTLFAAEPTVLKHDYAKWMLDDPRLNFAISARAGASGIRHLGLQVDTRDELQEIYQRLQRTDRPVTAQGATTCCYARSEKAWISDPQGVSWETFLTSGASDTYGSDPDQSANPTGGGCCRPDTPQGVCCPPKAGLATDAPCCGAASAAA